MCVANRNISDGYSEQAKLVVRHLTDLVLVAFFINLGSRERDALAVADPLSEDHD